MSRKRIAIIGDYDPASYSHPPTNQALESAIGELRADADYEWVATEEVLKYPETALGRFDGLWASPGSPYRSLEGMLAGIRFARESGKPFFAT